MLLNWTLLMTHSPGWDDGTAMTAIVPCHGYMICMVRFILLCVGNFREEQTTRYHVKRGCW